MLNNIIDENKLLQSCISGLDKDNVLYPLYILCDCDKITTTLLEHFIRTHDYKVKLYKPDCLTEEYLVQKYTLSFLEKRFSVSKYFVKQSINKLIEKGVIERMPGRGTNLLLKPKILLRHLFNRTNDEVKNE